ncbi:hypothetical protein GLOIN_2v811958 [Rhizophagus irregularis DAOM 181602=DAOM 197198]|nr:hypothetical protein GLOIN_2v811958 [Rhizophagus irregularis DAOM 181602=DAOM 197198]
MTANAFAVDIDRKSCSKLCKVEIAGDHNDQSRNLSPQDNDELFAIRKISKYFLSHQALLNESVHEFDVVVGPNRSGW